MSKGSCVSQTHILLMAPVFGKFLCHFDPHFFKNDNTRFSGASVMTDKHVKWSNILHKQPGRLFLFTLSVTRWNS